MTDSQLTADDVLVVDDDPAIREMLSRILKRLRYTVREAPDAEAAMLLMESQPASAVLIDRQMPGRGGDWLVSQILTRFPATAVVLATGEYVPTRVSERPGIVGYLSKPFSVEHVRDAVSDALLCHRVAARRRVNGSAST